LTLSSLMAISSPEMMLVPVRQGVSMGRERRALTDAQGVWGSLTKIDITKATAADFTANAVLITDTKILLFHQL